MIICCEIINKGWHNGQCPQQSTFSYIVSICGNWILLQWCHFLAIFQGGLQIVVLRQHHLVRILYIFHEFLQYANEQTIYWLEEHWVCLGCTCTSHLLLFHDLWSFRPKLANEQITMYCILYICIFYCHYSVDSSLFWTIRDIIFVGVGMLQ